uniref:Uncharacterized protein LOC102800601 n=1 Tax=Saccoglossus kowalevskii TaxID=10224 RepID=A0ABM0MNZ3_SACKO|nr:PREDICTED: uncharacterized protein LOC102800601 [Saccoglossus kowalevskii]
MTMYGLVEILAIFIISVRFGTEGCVYVYNGYCYEIVTGQMTWYDSRDYCEDNNLGHLADIKDAAENNYVMNTVFATDQCPSGKFVWIGVHDELVNAEYRTVHGEEITNTDFVSWSGSCCSDSKNCMTINGDTLKWKEFDCNSNADCGVMCKKDVDECMEELDNCQHVCENILGSFTCSCFDGYNLDADNAGCSDIDECVGESNNCQHVCENVIGGFTCSCFDGYKLNADNSSCTDVDECVEELDNCQHVCENTLGSFTCTCFDGYRLDIDNTSCTEIQTPIVQLSSNEEGDQMTLMAGEMVYFTLRMMIPIGIFSSHIVFLVPENSTCPILPVIDVSTNIGVNIDTSTAAEIVGPIFNDTQKITLDFLNLNVIGGDVDNVQNRLDVIVTTILDDLPCLENGSIIWFKAGVQYTYNNGADTIWVGQLSLDAYVGLPRLQVAASVDLTAAATAGDNVTISTSICHRSDSTAMAYDVTITSILSPFVKFSAASASSPHLNTLEVDKSRDTLIQFQLGNLGLYNREVKFQITLLIDPDSDDVIGVHEFIAVQENISYCDCNNGSSSFDANNCDCCNPMECQCHIPNNQNQRCVSCNLITQLCPLTDSYDRGYFVNTENDALFACSSSKDSSPYCFQIYKVNSTNIHASGIMSISNILGMDASTNTVYAISGDSGAYVFKEAGNPTWYSLSEADWLSASNGSMFEFYSRTNDSLEFMSDLGIWKGKGMDDLLHRPYIILLFALLIVVFTQDVAMETKCMRYYYTQSITHPKKKCNDKIVLMSRCSGSCEDTSSTDPVVTFRDVLRHPFKYKCQSCQDQQSNIKAVRLRCRKNQFAYATYRYILSCGCAVCKP